MPKVKLTGVATVTYTKTIDIPEDEIQEFIDACGGDAGETIECNLDPEEPDGMTINDWNFLDFKVLGG